MITYDTEIREIYEKETLTIVDSILEELLNEIINKNSPAVKQLFDLSYNYISKRITAHYIEKFYHLTAIQISSKIPLNWFEMFKQQHFNKWLLKKFPIKFTSKTVYANVSDIPSIKPIKNTKHFIVSAYTCNEIAPIYDVERLIYELERVNKIMPLDSRFRKKELIELFIGKIIKRIKNENNELL